jgi:hypothetical protein
LQDIYKLLDELEPVEEPESGFRPVKSYFFVPLAAALLLVALMSFISLLQRVALRRALSRRATKVQTHAS